MGAILEVFEDVVKHLFVFGVDPEASDGRCAALADGALFHDEWFSDGRDNAQRATAAVWRTGYGVSRPQDRREPNTRATHVPDRLRPQTTHDPVVC